MNKMVLSEKSSAAIWQMKAFAIFTVFFAHMPGHAYHGSSVVWQEIFSVIGVLGVPLFLMISGFFDKTSQTPLLIRFKRLIIPLFIWGSITFFLHILKTPSDSIIIDYIFWIYGCDNYLYFVPVLIWCILLSRLFNEWILVGIGLASQILSYYQIIPYDHILTPYVNPLNFIIYFSVGRLFREYINLESIDAKYGILSILVIAIFIFIPGLRPGYWRPYSVLFTTSLFCLSYWTLSRFVPAFLIQIGKYSYVLYLSHMQIAGFVHFSLQSFWGTWYEPIKVVVAFTISVCFCYVLNRILLLLHFNKLNDYLGFKA